jgi:putative DNA primase/helicase
MVRIALTPMVDHAIQYTRLGWHVFPVNQSKKPLTTNGFKDATKDEATIRRWWNQFPDANIGVATGAKSGIVVLDVDAAKEGAEDRLQQIIAEKGSFNQAVVSRTGGGGYHVFFKHPNGGRKVPNAQALFGFVGIDVRGDGGYVVLPPSQHASGSEYAWVAGQSPFDNAPGECPEYLHSQRGRGSAAVRLQMDGTIPEGERNATLTRVAGLVRTLGLGEEEILTVLRSQNATRCNPPLSEEELLVIASNIAKYPPARTNGTVAGGHPVLEALLQFPMTDVGFGQMIAFYLAEQVKYNHTAGKWLIWDQHFWKMDEVDEITLKVIDTISAFRRAVDLITDDDDRAAAFRYSMIMQGKSRIDAGASISKAQPNIATKHSAWNNNADLAACSNGVINLRTGELRAGRPSDLLSNHFPVNYDPNALCPQWLKFLDDVFEGGRDVINYLQRAIGYTLTGHTTEQCLFMLVGKGSNGKSTLMNVLQSIFGSNAFPAPFSTFERQPVANSQSNDIAALDGRRLVISSEPNEGVTLSESRIKSLTGGEPVSARFLHREFFTFHPVCKIWLGVNHLPRVVDDSDGFWRRVRRIDFNVRFVSPEEASEGALKQKPKDPDLGFKLRSEFPGILAWMVRGAIAWYRDGLQTPSAVQASTRNYRDDSDPLKAFFDAYCTFGENDSVELDTLYRAYTTDCKNRLLKPYEILPLRKFSERLKREFPEDRSARKATFISIGLAADGLKLVQPEQVMQININHRANRSNGHSAS